MVLLAGLNFASAQDTATPPGNENNTAPTLRFDAAVPSGPEQIDTSGQQTIRTKDFEITGPLVRPFKHKRLGSALKGFLQLFNPVAPGGEPDHTTRYEGLSSQPWSEIVGWRPGTSAFPDPATYSPSISLVSVAPAP